MRFDVARSTTQGIAKASERGTGNEKIPRFLFVPVLPSLKNV